ncbi:MAG: type III polyketide synthase [Chitinophagales bacterium]
MSKILSIGIGLPVYRHKQDDILDFMQTVYALDEAGKRKLRFLYKQSGIGYRHSVIPDYSLPANQWQFFHASENLEPFPGLELRMQWFRQHAPALSEQAIRQCLGDFPVQKITHLITVSCTGISAPGLDLELLELLQLPVTTFRTSVNFMGCYAAVHALKLADALCKADKQANVLLVCTELSTLHFQKKPTLDNLTSSLLFGDGSAAVLMTGDDEAEGLKVDHFFSMTILKGKKDMAWELSSSGFQMTLSGYVPDLIEGDFKKLVCDALEAANLDKEEITAWCIHPGGKKVLEAVHNSLGFTNGQLQNSYDVLRDYGNMSSATVLFVLKRIMDAVDRKRPGKIFGAAFGPGLTMETFILSNQ